MNPAKSHFAYLMIPFIIVGGFLSYFIDKVELVIFLNHHFAHPWLDVLFKYGTYLGDGIIYAFLIVALLFINYYYAILATTTAIVQTVFVHIFKKIIFKGMPRPTGIIPTENLQFVEGVDVHQSNTFPSGHTATGFAVFFLLALFARNHKCLSAFCFLMALMVGFSRVYLLQHFFVDIYFGALFGTLAVWCSWLACRPFRRAPALQKMLFFVK